MDEPVTDVKFVSSKDNCPEGYKIIEKTPCDHEAQLWEKVLGGESGERYLCFTKQDKDDLVIEDMYIPGRSAQYLYKGYKIVKETVEGDEPMYHKQLAIKRVPRTHATKVVADIIICRSRDNVSKMYKKLDKVNGLCICFRQDDVGGRSTPSPKHTRRATTSSSSSSSAPSFTPQRGGSLKIGDVSQRMAGITLSDDTSHRRGSGGIPLRRSVSPLASHSQTSPAPLAPSPPPREQVTVLHSTPPPELESTDANQPYTGGQPSAPPPSNTYHQPPNSTYPPPVTSTYPPPATSTYPPQPSNSYYPPPQPQTYPSAPLHSSSNYPPPRPGSYQPTTGYLPASGPAYGVPSGGLGFGAIAGGPPRYTSYPPPPGGYAGYGAVAGPSFTAAPTFQHNPSGAVPYNPYQSQQGPAPYPPPASSGASAVPSYGFKF